MFGTLKPHRCVLSEPVRAEHDHFYCGLCKSLGDHYGQVSRALVSHDAVFLALLVDGLTETPAKEGRCRCPLLPVVHRPIVLPDSVAMRFAAAVQMLLGDQWLADRAIEGKLLARVGRPLASRYVHLARKDLADLGIDVSSLDGFEARQAAREERLEGRERDAAEEIADVARPTSEALAFMLGRIADLPGAIEAVKSNQARADLAKLGDGLGRAIYFADALDDLEKDTQKGDFNPCVVVEPTLLLKPLGKAKGTAVPSPARVAICARLLRSALSDIREAANALPLTRHSDVLANILEHELPRAARKAESNARAYLEARSALALQRMGWIERGAHRVMVAVAVVFAWLFGSRDASADTKKRPSLPPSASASPDAGPPDAGDAGADAGAPPDSSAPKSPDVPWFDPKDPDPLDDHGSSAASGGGTTKEKTNGSGSNVATPTDVPNSHGSSCPCTDCKSCKSCDCCNACDCKGCDCCKGGNCCGGGGGGGCCGGGGGGGCCK